MSRSNRNTGEYRAYRGSGCVGTLPASKPGTPGRRRRTRPYVTGRHTGLHYHVSVLRGHRKIKRLIERAITTRPTRIATAVRRALNWKP